MRKLLVFLVLPYTLFAQKFSKEEITRWEKQAKQVTIIRDNWGIPHIYGKTDADAVFGLMYAQCEDDFKRIEMNYLEKLGGVSLVKGESVLYDDLLNAIVIDQEAAKADYKRAPEWLRKLCSAFADGINYYLYKHNNLPVTLNRFEPWYPLLWTDGSIGAINTAGITSDDLKNLYGGKDPGFSFNQTTDEEVLTGSNGFAFSPKITESGNAILYINPHVTFYFRPEVHMVSEEGLNVYGAVTWGQFFVYQGFNEHCGWMHTSSQVDAADSYIEKLIKKDGKWYYEYNNKQIPVIEKKVRLMNSSAVDAKEPRTFAILYTRHGPIMAKRNAQYLSVRADNRLMNGLIQCWQRTKTKSFADFKKTLDLLGNISNNTVYADAEGNIAYWHGNRIPIRDPKLDWSKPVDGSISTTEWKGYHKVDETVHLYNPANGWLQNCNSTPFTVAGNNSPRKNDYPSYMAPDGENFRGINAVRVLNEEKRYTIDKVIKAGYDTRLTAFEVLVPALIKAYEASSLGDSLNAILREPINTLKNWDYRCGENSVATTLAVTWGTFVQMLMRRNPQLDPNLDQVERTRKFAEIANGDDLLQAFYRAVKTLKEDNGTWQVDWGEINRYQRINPDIENKFDDSKPSLPVGFVSSQWGMLPSFTSSYFQGTKKRYGYNGNSFICAVEFGKRIKAKSLLTGGESGEPSSKHFFDQGLMYSKGQFKDVLFYKEDVLKHAEKTYHPGE
ncbi:MAG: acylase [Bacteroidetes bacterium]|nr:MAG: acylase [Bacteroidota bacterium]